MFVKKIKIGNVELKNNIFLAPMAGITDRAFRIVCEKFEPGLVYTEMISSKGLFHNDSKTKLLLNMEDEKRPIAVQIFGSDVESMKYAAEYVSKYADIIDINMGCPAPKVVKNGDGSKLLLDLPKAYEIIKEVVKSVSIPVTVKFRKGWDNDNIVAVDMAKIAEDAGASAITIHGRTRSEFYSGTADWNIIKSVKENVNIPVIGNGDIKTCFDAKRMLDETNCDLVMVGRGLLGNPWLIKEINEYLENGVVIDKPTDIEKIDMCLKHLSLLEEFECEKQAVLEIRSHVGWYLKGIKNANEVKQNIFKTKNINEIKRMLNELKDSLK